MAGSDELADHEELVRALTPPRWDPVRNRVSASAFQDFDVSVSRTAVLPYEQLQEIFVKDLHKPPNNPLQAALFVSAGAVRTACSSNAEFPAIVTIVADPVIDEPNASDNPAHALIKGSDAQGSSKKLSRGMSKAIIDAASQVLLIDL